ncbi:MAG: TRAP transporter large permease [Anaerovoracaceae bacterium]|jgi:tripartite ATP-independent transporter DctM subunit
MDVIYLTLIIMLVLLVIRVPVFLSILGACTFYFTFQTGTPVQIYAQRIMASLESTALLAIPFFITAGVCMNYSGVTKRIMDFCSIATGRWVGGLAQVNVLLSTLMGGLSGSNLADAAMEAKMLVPEMERHGYSKSFSTVVTAVSSLITPLIPPGIAMIIYGTVANVSIGKLFVSGLGIGIVTCATLMILVRIVSKKRGYTPMYTDKLPAKQMIKIILRAIPPLCLPIIIIGGIRLGVFTPTEAGAIAIIYALVLALFYREMSIRDFGKAMKESAITTSQILVIVASASCLGYILTIEQVPQDITQFLLSIVSNKYMFLIIVNIFLLIVGMFLEGIAAMLILIPLLSPAALAYGIDPVQFGMIVVFNLSIGTLTPPLGTIMFVTCGITKCPTKDFIKECIPFYIQQLIVLLLITFVPAVSLGLVNLIY